jgi:hypothetical protein
LARLATCRAVWYKPVLYGSQRQPIHRRHLSIKPGKNSTIITIQNIGPQCFSLYHQTSAATSQAFKDSQAGIALYAECSLIESLLPAGNGFNNRMRIQSPKSFSRLTNNTNERYIAKWYQRGGAAFTVQNNIKSHQTSHGTDKSGLGRWIWTRLRGKGTTYTRLVSAYLPCNNKGIGWHRLDPTL